MSKRFAVIAVVVGAVACGGSTAKQRAKDADERRANLPRPDRLVAPRAAEAPPDLFGVIVMPKPTTAIGQLNALYARLVPGSQPLDTSVFDLLVGSVIGGTPIVGIDHGKPVYVMFVDPAVADPWIVAMVSVRDEQRLLAWADADGLAADVRGGVAVVGSPAAVSVVADYAATNLAGKPLPAHVTATVFAERIRVKYSDALTEVLDVIERQLAASPDPKTARAAKIYTDAGYAFVQQLDTLSMSYEQSGTDVSIVFELAGVQSSTLAKVAAAQRPSDYSILDVFDMDTAPIGMAADVDWGPLESSFLGMMELLFSELAVNAEARGAWAQLMKQYHGQAVMRFDLAPFRVTSAYEVRDPKEALRLSRIWATSPVGQETGVTLEAVGTPSFTHKGIPVDEYKMKLDPTARAAAQQVPSVGTWLSTGITATAAVDPYLITIMSPDATAVMKTWIDTLERGDRGTASKSAVAAASRARRESVMMWFDVGALVAAVAPDAPAFDARVDFGIGFTDTSWLFRVSAGLDDLAAMVGAANTAQQPQHDPTLVTDIDALADEACACKDIACAEQVQAKLMARIQNAVEPPMDEQERILKSLERMGGCMTTIAAPPPNPK